MLLEYHKERHVPERNHQLPPELPTPDSTQELAAVRHVVEELTSKIQWLVEFLDHKGLLEDHSFTFPDGDVWKTRDIEP